jgi:hypothetical protein
MDDTGKIHTHTHARTLAILLLFLLCDGCLPNLPPPSFSAFLPHTEVNAKRLTQRYNEKHSLRLNISIYMYGMNS